MLKKLTIRNFKAIEDLTIEFTPITILIGENSCGKSTVLQVLDFLRSVATRDIHEYLNEKGWAFSDLKTKSNTGINKSIEFVSEYEFENDTNIDKVIWQIFIDIKDGKYNIRELISINDKGIIAYSTIPLVDDTLIVPETPNPFKTLKLESSLLKIMDMSSIDDYFMGHTFYGKKDYKSIIPLKEFLSVSINFELLSPDRLRSGKKLPYSKCIGAGGEALSYFIHKMKEQERCQLNKIVSDLIGSNVEIQTFDQGSRVELTLVVKKTDETMYIDSEHISDGLLRIIAYAAITMDTMHQSVHNDDVYVAEPKEKYISGDVSLSNGIILLDEIENGINPYLTEKILLMLRNYSKENRKQVVLTTHSPVILNDFDQKEIIFMWKEKNGSVHAKKFFETEEMKDTLEFLNPGEVWLNYSKDDLIEKMNGNTMENN